MNPTVNPAPQKKSEWNWQGRLFLVIALLIPVGIIFGIIMLIVVPLTRGNDILKNGIETTGTSTGQIYQDSVKNGKYTRSIQYKAYYTYEVDGKAYEIIGSKDYFKNENIKKGMTATIKYLKDDPTKSIVDKEE